MDVPVASSEQVPRLRSVRIALPRQRFSEISIFRFSQPSTVKQSIVFELGAGDLVADKQRISVEDVANVACEAARGDLSYVGNLASFVDGVWSLTQAKCDERLGPSRPAKSA